MKIDKIHLPEAITSPCGLKPIHMERLNNIVLIAGKNGAGKSRLLQLIKQQIIASANNETIARLNQNIITSKSEIDINQGYIDTIKKRLLSEKNTNQKDNDTERFKKNIENAIINIEAWKTQIELITTIKFIPDKEENGFFDFVPQSLHLLDSYTISSQQLDAEARHIYSIGTNSISRGVIPAIENIQKRWVNANTTTTEDFSISEEEKKQINLEYDKLKKYIKLFLNADLKRTKDGYPEIFNKRIGEAKLSNGQTILLQFCMALFAQEVSLEKLIIFMDEPENHLHPAALIEVLDKIKPHVTNGQIWIATHSINVLAHFDPSNIWYIDNGEISYAGNVPNKVLQGLLGTENEIANLTNFLSLPAQMASTQFAFESLFYPNVVITGVEDPQVNQIHEIIKDRSLKGEKLKVLDFGIGKGRLISTIFENERARSNDITKWLDYFGYDKFDTHKDTCTKILAEIYGAFSNRYFNEFKEICAKHEENSFDVIVMCNVFHEIDSCDWLNLFQSVTSPFKLLKDTGFLLIVEDQFLAVGEKAHSKGFLVFDELEFKTLFKITKDDGYQSTDYRNDGRLKSHHIPKRCLNRIDVASKKSALEILFQNAKDEMKKIRKLESPTFKNGKQHGFWSQQLANASLALEELH